MLGHWYLGVVDGVRGAWGHVVGGMSSLISSLESSAKGFGVDIYVGSEVSSIIVVDGEARGVELVDGRRILSKAVLSTVDPKTTILGLVGRDIIDSIDRDYRRRVESIKMEGIEFKINLALEALPKFYGFDDKYPYHGVIAISPSMEYLERAYDDAKYGSFSKEPYIEMVFPSVFDDSFSPPGKHVVSIYCQYTPYSLRDHEWDDGLKEEFYNEVMDILSLYSPDFRDKVLHRYLVSPLDMEVRYGIARGHVGQGETSPSQILSFRPVTGFSDYTTPIRNLYIGGAGTHPGGGLFGAAGHNVAYKIIDDLVNL
jgi:phytoene dehydrogenase-like protein